MIKRYVLWNRDGSLLVEITATSADVVQYGGLCYVRCEQYCSDTSVVFVERQSEKITDRNVVRWFEEA